MRPEPPGCEIDPTYEVECKIEVRASSPEQAASIARDMMLDPDSRLFFHVYPFEYVEAAGESHPTGEHGWAAYFGDWHGKRAVDPVRPTDCVAWVRAKL
jgi:hypothetical protein